VAIIGEKDTAAIRDYAYRPQRSGKKTTTATNIAMQHGAAPPLADLRLPRVR
jgi:hypothetical protein